MSCGDLLTLPTTTEHDWDVKDNRAVSELLQHEIDHLDGVLSIDRATSVQDIVSRDVWAAKRAFFQDQVDGYEIEMTQ